MNEKSAEKAAGEPKAFPLKWALRGVAVAGVAAVVYIIVQASINPQRETDLKSLAKGEMAKFEVPLEAAAPPAASFLDADGAPKRIADFRGQVTVVNLWATWCPPCRREMPVLQQASQQHPQVRFLWVNQGEDQGKTARYAAQQGLPAGKVLLDTGSELSRLLSINGLPTTLFYNAEGTLVALRTGELSAATLAERLALAKK